MNIPIIGKPELGPYPTNMFYSQAAHKELSLPGLMGTPGLKAYYDSSYAKPVRCLHVMGDHLYAVIGDRTYKINGSPAVGTLLTGTLTTNSGPTLMEDDGTNLMIVDPGVEGYIYASGGNVTAIADADFPVPSFLTWQDGYFIVTEKSSGRFWISTLYDPTAWDGTDWTTAEGNPDNTLAIFSDHEDVFNFGTASIQPYYNSGADFPFEVKQGASITEGIGAAHSVAAGDNTVFFIDRTGRVMRISGYNAQPISSRKIEKEISELSTFSDAIGFYYTQQGHGFYVINFPDGDMAWAFDVTTQQWHKRRSYPINADGSEGRWRANCYAFFDGKHIVGDWETGKLYELDFDTYTDNSETLRRFVDFPAIGNGKDRIRHNKLEVMFEGGVGLVGGDNPQAVLRWSDDGGKTWSNQLWTGIGELGDYTTRAIWRRLGASRRRIYRISVTDAVKVIITSAHLN